MSELELLQEIDTLHKTLLHEPLKPVNYGGPDCCIYCSNVENLITKIKTLQSDFNVNYANNVLDQHINSVLGREIEHVRWNLSNQNKKEVIILMNKANNALDRLFNPIFQKIEELKE